MILQSAAILLGFIVLVWGADRFVSGAAAIARLLDIPPLIIGLTIVGLGTSAPEIIVSGLSAWEDNAGLAIGNAIGSNIANIGLVLGATALISPIRVASSTLRREIPVLLLVMFLAWLVIHDLELDALNSATLLAGLLALLVWMVRLARNTTQQDPLQQETEQELPATLPPKSAIFWFLVGLITLLIGAKVLVWGAIGIAHALGISDLVIGLTVIAVGTSLPELATSILSSLRGEDDLAIGNVIGSNMFNLLAVLPIPGLIGTQILDIAVISRDMPTMTLLTLLLCLLCYGFKGPGRINRMEGGLLLLCFFAYQSWLLF